MKKGSTAIWVIIILVIIVGAVAYSMSRPNVMDDNTMMGDDDMMVEDHEDMMGDEMMEKDDSMMMDEKKDDAMMEGDEEAMMMKESGSYEAYSPEKLSKANEGDVVLFFRASWCPTCRALDSDIKSNLESIPSGVTILDVNYDTEVALKQKYGVTYQHTLVQVDADGNQIAKWTGSPTLASLVGNIK